MKISPILCLFYRISHLLGMPHGPDLVSSGVVCCVAGAPALLFTCSGSLVPTVVAFTPLSSSVVVVVIAFPLVVFVAPAGPVDVAATATGSCFAVVVLALSSSHAKLTLDTAW